MTPMASPPTGSSETRSPTRPTSSTRATGVRPRRRSRTRASAATSRTSMSRQLGQRQQAEVGERVVEPRPAERAEDRRSPPVAGRGRPRRRAPCRTRPCRRRRDRTGTPSASSAAMPASPERVAVADPAVDAQAERPRRGARRRRRRRPARSSASQPGQASSSAARDATSPSARTMACVGRLHGADASGLARDPMLDSGRARPVRPSGRPTRPRRRRAQGRDLDVVTFDESTHTAEEAAAAVGAELGQIVKSLVFVAPSDDGPEPIVCLVSGPNRVDVARLAAVTGEPDIRRATAREAQRPDRLRHRWHPADRVRAGRSG